VISEIADHFILDKTDVLKNQKNNPDFIAWWALQPKIRKAIDSQPGVHVDYLIF
jgi:hypothetical protein